MEITDMQLIWKAKKHDKTTKQKTNTKKKISQIWMLKNNSSFLKFTVSSFLKKHSKYTSDPMNLLLELKFPCNRSHLFHIGTNTKPIPSLWLVLELGRWLSSQYVFSSYIWAGTSYMVPSTTLESSRDPTPSSGLFGHKDTFGIYSHSHTGIAIKHLCFFISCF